MSGMYRYDQAFTDAMDELREDAHEVEEDDAMQPGWYQGAHDTWAGEDVMSEDYDPDELMTLMKEGL